MITGLIFFGGLFTIVGIGLSIAVNPAALATLIISLPCLLGGILMLVKENYGWKGPLTYNNTSDSVSQKVVHGEKKQKISDDEKLGVVKAIHIGTTYAEKFGKKEEFKQCYEDFILDVLNFVIPNNLEENFVEAFAAFYFTDAYSMLKVAYIKEHPKTQMVEDWHAVQDFQERKTWVISAIISYPPRINENLQEYAAMVVLLSIAPNEEYFNLILKDNGREPKRKDEGNFEKQSVDDEENIRVKEWADSVVEYITSQNLKHVLQNDLTLIDFVLYWYFNCYVAFCKIVKDQKKSSEFANQFREWYAEYTKKKGLERNFAEELYWNRIEGYNEIMMSGSADKDGTLMNAIEQFMKKSRFDTPFEKALVTGDFMETFEMNAEIAYLYRDTGKATDEKFKELCEYFKTK